MHAGAERRCGRSSDMRPESSRPQRLTATKLSPQQALRKRVQARSQLSPTTPTEYRSVVRSLQAVGLKVHGSASQGGASPPDDHLPRLVRARSPARQASNTVSPADGRTPDSSPSPTANRPSDPRVALRTTFKRAAAPEDCWIAPTVRESARLKRRRPGAACVGDAAAPAPKAAHRSSSRRRQHRATAPAQTRACGRGPGDDRLHLLGARRLSIGLPRIQLSSRARRTAASMIRKPIGARPTSPAALLLQ
jgi:hypothetical protein